jgi:predicted dehydrogenase
MTTTVKVIGAGSIGNHLAQGCRTHGWEVTIVDLSPEALQRTQDTIYPSRYGAWDSDITLATPGEVAGKSFDIVIVGTPPATHLSVATAELAATPPKLLLIEKPLSHPDPEAIIKFLERAERAPTRVLVGYNQRHKPNTHKFLEVASDSSLGALTGLSSHMLESWDGILKAHFWMKSEKDSYLAFTDQGGGALLEHSHALNLFLHFAQRLGQGSVIAVDASIEWVDHESGRYDRDALLNLTLESGLVGEVRQDLHTWPAKKEAVATFENGRLVWAMGDSSDAVYLFATNGTLMRTWDFPKTRPDDFRGEISHLEELLHNPELPSSLDLSEGLSVMEVALAAIDSSVSGRATTVTKIKAST